jgi:hypothetical protein
LRANLQVCSVGESQQAARQRRPCRSPRQLSLPARSHPLRAGGCAAGSAAAGISYPACGERRPPVASDGENTPVLETGIRTSVHAPHAPHGLLGAAGGAEQSRTTSGGGAEGEASRLSHSKYRDGGAPSQLCVCVWGGCLQAMTTEIDELSGERSHPSTPPATTAQPTSHAKAGKLSFRSRR